MLEKLKTQAEVAKEKTQELRSLAKNRGSKVTKKLKIEGKKLSTSERDAKRASLIREKIGG